jgi:uncharacterized protein YjdB
MSFKHKLSVRLAISRICALLVAALSSTSCQTDTTDPGFSGTQLLLSEVDPPTVSIIIAPASASLAVGGTQQLTATLKDAAGNVLENRPVFWSSSDPAVATVTASGLVTAIAAGSATISAASQFSRYLEAASGALTAPMARVDSAGTSYVRSTTPNSGSASYNFSVPVDGTYYIWSRILAPNGSEDSYFVSVDGGAEDVYDVAEGRWEATWQWTVVNGRGTSGEPLTLDPRPFQLTAGSHTLTFRGREAHTKLDRIFITDDAGAAPNDEGTSVRATASITVMPAALVASVTVAPASATLAVGGTQQLTAILEDAAGNVLGSRTAHWSSSNPAVARVTTSGFVTAIATGSATISAAPQFSRYVEAESGSLAAPMARVDSAGTSYVRSTTPNSGSASYAFSVPVDGTYYIWGRIFARNGSEDSYFVSVDGGAADVYDVAEGRWAATWQWTVVNGRGTSGQPLALNPQAFKLTAGSHTLTFRGREAHTKLDRIFITDDPEAVPNDEGTSVRGSASVTVTPTSAEVVSVSVAPASASMGQGKTLQLTATVKDSAGNVVGEPDVFWSSSNPTVASVNASGLVTALAAGSAAISAAAGPSPSTGTSSLSSSGPAAQQFSTYLEAENGALVEPMAQVDSAGSSFVRSAVANGGTASYRMSIPADGTYYIWARVIAPVYTQDSYFVSVDGGVEDVYDVAEGTWAATWQWTVVNGRGTSGEPLTLNPRPFHLTAGSHTLTFRGRDAHTKLDRIFITADSSAVPSDDGTLIRGTASITVLRTPVASVTVSPAAATLAIGGTQQLVATLKNAAGNTLSGRTVSWSSANASVATVSSTGVLTAVGEGSASITATSEGQSASGAITVQAAVTHSGFYVAPNGSASGNGSIENPWNLGTALAHPAAVQPGDTIWLRGGMYRGDFTSSLTGTSGSPVVVRRYPGERATIDGTLEAQGGYTWFWGLEVMNSNASTQNVPGVTVVAPGTALINLVIHDHSGSGMGVWEEAPDAIVYGNIVYYNGFHGSTSTSHGHGIYTQNATGDKLIADNIIFNQYGTGLHAYGQSGQVRNYQIQGNVFFNNAQFDVLVQSGAVAEHVHLVDNLTYRSNGGSSLLLGKSSGTSHKDVTVRANYLVGKVMIHRWAKVTFTDNVLRRADKLELGTATNTVPLTYRWDRNDYLMNENLCGGTCPFGTYLAGNPANHSSLAAWRTATRLDANSVGVQTATGQPSGKHVVVRPNAYEPGRGHVIVYNWAGSASVSVDVSPILDLGDTYEVRNVLNYFGAPVATGTYNGGTITLPTTGVRPPSPLGGGSFANLTPQFSVFAITRPGS